MSKFCRRCKTDKDNEAFAKSARRPDGLQCWCRECRKAYVAANKARYRAEWRARYMAKAEHYKELARQQRQRKGSAAIAEYNKDYWQKNSDSLKRMAKAYKATDPERWRAYNRTYYQDNKAMFLERRRQYVEANYPAVLEHCRRRTARLIQAIPEWSDLDAVRASYVEAVNVSASTGVAHHVDHIVPLTSKIVCGLHVPVNLRVITGSANASKGNRHWPDMP